MNVASRGHRLGTEATPESTASLRPSMAAGEVLDTAALIAWPLERMRGSLVVPSQRAELSRISPDREIMLDAAALEWASPGSAAIARASGLATTTGDMAGLSPVDLELLALAIERAATLATDDYRLQNLCELGGVPWLSVTMEGISSLWSWELRCTGCGAVLPSPDTPSSRRELGNCSDCGSTLKLSRKRD
jgi:rRNA maturation endonuclease Nob1